MDALDDRSLWAAALAGDGRAYGVLFERHRDRVFRALLRSSPTASDAEDLTAIVFLELWRRRDDARMVDATLLPWLLVTAGNVARNANRARRRYTGFLAALPRAEAQPDFADEATARLDAAAASAALQSSLDALSATDRHLIVLTAVEGFSLAEASTAVGLSYNTAKTRLSRARAKLRHAHPELSPLEAS